MDLAGGLGRLGALLDRPGAALVAAGGEEGDKPQKGVAALDEQVEAGLADAQLLHEHGLFLGVVQLGDVGLQLGADGQYLAALFLGQLLHGHVVAVPLGVGHIVLTQVGGVDGLFEGEKITGGNERHFILASGEGARQLALVEVLQEAGEELSLF